MKVQDLLRAIVRKCLDCSGGDKEQVDNCPVRDCPLYPWRKGQDQASLFGDDDDRPG